MRLYNGTTYIDGSSLDVFEGAFLNSEVNVTIDIPSYSSSGRREADAQKTATFESQLNWSIPLKAYVGEYGYELSNLIRSSEEKWDPAPPRFPKYTEIVFQKTMGSTNGYIEFDEKTYFNMNTRQYRIGKFRFLFRGGCRLRFVPRVRGTDRSPTTYKLATISCRGYAARNRGFS